MAQNYQVKIALEKLGDGPFQRPYDNDCVPCILQDLAASLQQHRIVANRKNDYARHGSTLLD
jgi:hypothetical protein